MFGLILLSVALIVVGQLDAMQHAALMTFYDAVGAFVEKKNDFCFFFTPAFRLQQRDLPSLHGESTVQWW